MSVRGGFSTPIIGITFMRRGERVACQSSLPSSLDKHRSINTNSLITGRLFIGTEACFKPWFHEQIFREIELMVCSIFRANYEQSEYNRAIYRSRFERSSVQTTFPKPG